MFTHTTVKKNRNRRGSAALLAMTATIPLMGVAGTLLMVTVHHRSETEESALMTAARDAAASGAQDAMAKLTVDPAFTGAYDLTVGNCTSHVVVSDWANDHVDIDISATGHVNSGGGGLGAGVSTEDRSAGVLVKKTKLNIVANTAFYVDDALANFNFNGTAFLIKGNDTNLDGTKGPKPAIPGIGTPGNPNGIISQLSAKQKPDVVGLGGSPSVQTVVADDLTADMSAISPLATLNWTGSDVHLSNGIIGDLPHLKAQIAHAKGNLFLSGNTKGCGILVVDGNLEVTGNFDFVGVMYVNGSVTFKGGGGAKNIRGALFTPGNVNGEDVDISGSIQITYSSQAIDIVNTQLSAGVQLISWTQK
jgi:hypothetical protein